MQTGIVKELWKRGTGPYSFISFRTPEGWVDNPVGAQMLEALRQPDGWDVFFTPLTFDSDRRQALNAVAPSVLFADLDPVHPDTLDPKPSIAWETSPGSYQAVWLLTEPMKYLTKWSELNRRMTYHTDADKGGWSASKVLRVPGSVNYKYPEAPQGALLWADFSILYEADALNSQLPDLSNLKVEEGSKAPEIITSGDKLNEIWARMPPRIQWRLNKKNIKDRSRFIVSTAWTMRDLDVDKLDAFHMLWWAPFNKWRFRNNPDRLWLEITQVYE